MDSDVDVDMVRNGVFHKTNSEENNNTHDNIACDRIKVFVRIRPLSTTECRLSSYLDKVYPCSSRDREFTSASFTSTSSTTGFLENCPDGIKKSSSYESYEGRNNAPTTYPQHDLYLSNKAKHDAAHAQGPGLHPLTICVRQDESVIDKETMKTSIKATESMHDDAINLPASSDNFHREIGGENKDMQKLNLFLDANNIASHYTCNTTNTISQLKSGDRSSSSSPKLDL